MSNKDFKLNFIRTLKLIWEEEVSKGPKKSVSKGATSGVAKGSISKNKISKHKKDKKE